MSYLMAFGALSLANLVKQLPEGSGPADEEQADAVVTAVEELGTPLGTLEHSAGGGKWFREQFMRGPVAEALGLDLVNHLLDRPINGFTWDHYPCFGWADNAELRAALTRLEKLGAKVRSELDGDDLAMLDTIVHAVRQAVAGGKDLVTVYS
jgi:hypothetical protein